MALNSSASTADDDRSNRKVGLIDIVASLAPHTPFESSDARGESIQRLASD